MSDVLWNCFHSFRYLHQVLDEALRCSALAPFAARFEDVESELGGHRIPAGVSARARTALVKQALIIHCYVAPILSG